MRRSVFRWRRVAALSWLAAFLLLAGCQSTAQLPPWLSGTKPAPPVASPPPLPAPAAAPAQGPAGPAEPAPERPDLGLLATPPAEPPPPAPPVSLIPAAPRAAWRAAVLLPLSGPQAATGQALSNAAQMALFDAAPSRFTLVPYDTRGTPEGAAAAAAAALAQGADILIGPLMSGEVRAVAPLARARAVPVLAFTSDRTVAGAGIYALGFFPGQQVARVLAQAHEQGARRIGALIRSDDLGRAVAQAVRDAAPALGLEVVALDYYDMTATDLSGPVKRLAAHRPPAPGKPAFDAILIADEGARLRSITSLLSYYLTEGPAPRLLGTLLWDDPALSAEPQLAGGWYAAPPAQAHAVFEQRYQKAFGPIPPRAAALAGLAYDAAALAGALAGQGNGEFTPAALAVATGFSGAEGLFRLTPEGLAERAYAIREIGPQGSREVVAAPAAFGAAGAVR